MESGSQLEIISSDRLEKPGIELATSGLQREKEPPWCKGSNPGNSSLWDESRP